MTPAGLALAIVGAMGAATLPAFPATATGDAADDAAVLVAMERTCPAANAGLVSLDDDKARAALTLKPVAPAEEAEAENETYGMPAMARRETPGGTLTLYAFPAHVCMVLVEGEAAQAAGTAVLAWLREPQSGYRAAPAGDDDTLRFVRTDRAQGREIDVYRPEGTSLVVTVMRTWN